MRFLVLMAMAAVLGCTDADMANFTTLGSSGEVKCYSGGQLIYRGISTGKIQTVSQSDGWEFKDSATGKFVRVSGDCVITN